MAFMNDIDIEMKKILKYFNLIFKDYTFILSQDVLSEYPEQQCIFVVE